MDMQTQPPPTPDTAQLVLIQRKLFLDGRIRNGANWFFWIAGLSLLNTVMYLFGITLTFVVGLGATQIVDGFMAGVAESLGQNWSIVRFIDFAIDVCIAGIFVLFGILGRKRHLWAVILGMVLYALDGIVLLLFRDYFGAAFHAWALLGIAGSLKPMGELKMLEEAGNSESIESLRQRLPSVQQPGMSPQRKLAWLVIIVGIILVVVTLLTIAALQQ